MSDVISDQPTLQRKLIAEAIGTALLVLGGCGAVIYPQAYAGRSGVDLIVVAAAFGLALLIGLVTVGRISGGHFNPAVSAAVAASGRMSWREAGAYSLAQIGGGIVGAVLLWITALGFTNYSNDAMGLGANGFGGAHASWWSAIVIEYVFTAIFVVVILSVTDKRFAAPAVAPALIALTLTGIHLATLFATGTSLNPARSIGPALFSGGHAIGQLWLFILAPLGGAVAGAGAYVALFGRDAEPVAGSGIPTLAEVRAASKKVSKKPEVPAWQQPQEPTGEGEPPVYEQDGWRWDYGTQTWVPADGAPAEPTTQIKP